MKVIYSRVEKYRKEIQAKDFKQMSGWEVEELRKVYYFSEFAEMIGDRPSPETYALLDMFLSEKVPPEVSETFITLYVCEEIILRNMAPPGRTIQ